VTMRERILAVLSTPPVPPATLNAPYEDELPDLLGLPAYEVDGSNAEYDELWSTLGAMVEDGTLGSSYQFDEVVPGCGLIGRVYFVWLKSPDTAEYDREQLELDMAWAAITGGIFSRDSELLRRAGRQISAGGDSRA
jgi:hypothetical protein